MARYPYTPAYLPNPGHDLSKSPAYATAYTLPLSVAGQDTSADQDKTVLVLPSNIHFIYTHTKDTLHTTLLPHSTCLISPAFSSTPDSFHPSLSRKVTESGKEIRAGVKRAIRPLLLPLRSPFSCCYQPCKIHGAAVVLPQRQVNKQTDCGQASRRAGVRFNPPDILGPCGRDSTSRASYLSAVVPSTSVNLICGLLLLINPRRQGDKDPQT